MQEAGLQGTTEADRNGEGARKGVEEKRSLNRALEDRMGGEVKKEKQSGGQG